MASLALVLNGVCITGAVPSDPSALTATAISQTRIDGTYTKTANVPSTHSLEYSSNGGGSWTTVTVSGGAYSVTGLTILTNYLFRLRAIGVWGNSAYTATVGCSTPSNPPSLYPALDFHDARNSMYVGAKIV